MKLLKFRVKGFRSVDDSEWIDVSEVTALIGTNESGKTNLLLPLWKLNPAGSGGEIDLLADAPRRRYSELRAGDQTEVFIQALFETDSELRAELSKLTGAPQDALTNTSVERRFDGKYHVRFPGHSPLRQHSADIVREPISSAVADIERSTPLKSEEVLKEQILGTLRACLQELEGQAAVDAPRLTGLKAKLESLDTKGGPKTSVIVPRLSQLTAALAELMSQVTLATADSVESARLLVVKHLPKFVYYSNYGNLDSEIYLPHVIENMARAGLGSKEAAKARTLKVLFSFVRLEPEEILELGRDFKPNPARKPSEEEVAEIARKKKERDVLLQSASTELTTKFRDWWKQGTYRFRFQADGDHFRIWVSDDRRPEDIELEGRSTGLQWFLSFYLIFLVESAEAHSGAILLLDEPGLSLHPLGQRDLSHFFDNLASTNQLLYTTHSPFLVDPNHLDRVKAVYVRDDGTTGVSSDLRAGEKQLARSRSIYPVYAAFGISVSDILLVGAEPIVVEGTADQFYLSAFKTILIARGLFVPPRELLFLPAGGTKGVKAIAAILSGKDEIPPAVILDADTMGSRMASELKSSLYSGMQSRVISVSAVTSVPNAEMEDLIPQSIIVPALDRLLRAVDEDFSAVYKSDQSIVPQVEGFAARHNITLAEGWKVDLAKSIKVRLLRADGPSIDTAATEVWQNLFNLIPFA